MLKFYATNVGVSRGYNENPAVSFSPDGKFVRFRIGAKVYDKNAENNCRWVNITVKAFGEKFCERIRKMELKEGSMLNLVGRYDEDVWTDTQTNEKKSMPVIILEDLEYCFSGGKKSDSAQKTSSTNSANPPAAMPTDTPAFPGGEMPGNFSGFEPFSGGGQFFDM